MRFFVFFFSPLSLDECFAPVTHESSKWRGEPAISRRVNDAVSAERCHGAPHSRFVIVPPTNESNNSSWLAQWESALGCTCRGRRTGGEQGPQVKLCMRSVLKSWRSPRFHLFCTHSHPMFHHLFLHLQLRRTSTLIYILMQWICVDKCACLRFRYTLI